MKRLLLFLSVTAAIMIPAVTWAQITEGPEEYPWYSPKRLVVGARLERVWYDNQIPRDEQTEWAGGLAASWVLVPKLSLTGRYLHGIASQEDYFAVGLNLKLFDGYRDLK